MRASSDCKNLTKQENEDAQGIIARSDNVCDKPGISLFGTLKHRKTDADSLLPSRDSENLPGEQVVPIQPITYPMVLTNACYYPPKIDYPKPDGVLTFDRFSSMFLSNTNHEEDQPVHLKIKDMDLQLSSEFAVFAGPSTRYCPAG